jgi:hypothetical protein
MEWQYITTKKSFKTLALNTVLVYCRILTLENVGTVVNYCGIFITSALGRTLDLVTVPPLCHHQWQRF